MIDPKQIKEWKNLILSKPQRGEDEKEVIKRYGTMFHPSNLDKLTKEEFKSFLLMKNNKHWDGIHRQGNIITSNMGKLIKALKILLDENQDLETRLNKLFPKKGDNYLKGLGKATATPILLVVYPKKYGVWNNKSEEGLMEFGILPNFKRKSFTEKYIAINDALNDFAEEYDLTLWQADEIIGHIAFGNSPIGTMEEGKSVIQEMEDEKVEDFTDFGLEAHLEEFLIENWDKIPLGKKYDILEEDGDMLGQQYITPVGRMDILTKSKDGKEWLVIELKKGRSSDAVVGQTLRYIGWLEENKVKDGEKVNGLIIVGEDDDKLKYSIKTVKNIKLMTYSVTFKLKSSK